MSHTRICTCKRVTPQSVHVSECHTLVSVHVSTLDTRVCTCENVPSHTGAQITRDDTFDAFTFHVGSLVAWDFGKALLKLSIRLMAPEEEMNSGGRRCKEGRTQM